MGWLFGTTSKPGSHLNYASEIEHQYPRDSLKELKAAKDAKEWSLQSRAVAIDAAYLRGARGLKWTQKLTSSIRSQ
jgi:hypothetical protein